MLVHRVTMQAGLGGPCPLKTLADSFPPLTKPDETLLPLIDNLPMMQEDLASRFPRSVLSMDPSLAAFRPLKGVNAQVPKVHR